MKTSKTLYKTFSIIIWSILTFITLFPIYWMILVSTRTPVELYGKPNLSPTFFEKIYWKNYTKPFIDGVFGDYLLNSIIIATSNALIVTILAVMATYALSRFKIAGAETIFFWTMTNRMAPPAAFMLPLFLLFTKVFKFGDSTLFDTKIGLILLYCVFNLPFAIWLLKGIIDGIPKELDEAMIVDGANLFTVFRKLIIPLAAPGIAVTSLLSFLFAWNEYLLATTLSSVYSRTIPTGLSEFVTTTGTEWGTMAAVAVVSMLPALIFLALVQKYIVTGLTFGAVKA
ncbi:MAG: carbohydrate ABC transporter permease [SAR324 cluster bacterium]|nr:carbohydrate ABC transporter permease [SAR324 cluster bacterium]MDP7500965.1 carbohydrate ABC transporter permease [SAR324 cluster bacterium]|tara:strand:- start:5342 stop:6196 length:855 start_codon:yes stop_codon:yes gene_type:complete